jgi:hypothetical protein
MKLNRYTLTLAALVGWTSFLIGHCIASVGQTPECRPFAWTLPITMFVFVSIPAVLGFILGRESW